MPSLTRFGEDHMARSEMTAKLGTLVSSRLSEEMQACQLAANHNNDNTKLPSKYRLFDRPHSRGWRDRSPTRQLE